VTALQTDTLTDELAVAADTPSVGPDMQQLWRRFPPRAAATTWPVTEQRREPLLAELLAASALVDEGRAAQQRRRLGLTRLMDWLADQPGDTWQQRWVASGAAPTPRGTRTGGSRCSPGHVRRRLTVE